MQMYMKNSTSKVQYKLAQTTLISFIRLRGHTYLHIAKIDIA